MVIYLNNLQFSNTFYYNPNIIPGQSSLSNGIILLIIIYTLPILKKTSYHKHFLIFATLLEEFNNKWRKRRLKKHL